MDSLLTKTLFVLHVTAVMQLKLYGANNAVTNVGDT